ncbi:MAG: hypothetical protein ACREHD_30840 [Pirellulales bacterium]
MKKKYWEMNTRELAAATKQFDEERVIDQSRPLDTKERAQWKRLKTAKQRPNVGNAHQRISVSIEKGLLKRATAYAKKQRLSRSRLVAMALEQALSSQGKKH